MAGAPEAGWYQDPADASRHRYWDGGKWTEKTRVGGLVAATIETALKRNRTWAIVAALLVVALVGTAIALVVNPESSPVAKSSPDPTPRATESQPPPVPTTDPSEVVIPEGWLLYTSVTGVLSYAVPPEWTDILRPEDQDYLHEAFAGMPETTSEYSGGWLLAGTYWGDNTSTYIMSTSDGTVPRGLRYIAKGWASSDVDHIEYLVDEEYVTPRGYAGWRLEYEAAYSDGEYSEILLLLQADTTLVYIYLYSRDSLDPYREALFDLADSLVVHHPPAER